MVKAKIARKYNVFLVILGIILLSILAFFLTTLGTAHAPQNIQNTQAGSQTQLLKNIVSPYTDVAWSMPQLVKIPTQYGDISGRQMTTTMKTDKAMVVHQEDDTALKNMGFTPDMMLSADGPGSSQWAYKKTTGNNSSQILLFSYQTKPSANQSSNEPLQFNCPCTVTMTAFLSNPFPLSNE